MDIQDTFCGSVAPKEADTPQAHKSRKGPGQKSKPVGLNTDKFNGPPIA